MDKDADGSSGFDVERVEDLEGRLREREAHFDVVRPNRVVRELFSHTAHTHTHTHTHIPHARTRTHTRKEASECEAARGKGFQHGGRLLYDTRKSRAMSDWLRMMNEWSR
jgi:hypothetical protein